MLRSWLEFMQGVIPGHPWLSYFLCLVIFGALLYATTYWLTLVFFDIFKVLVSIVAILVDKEHRDQFLGYHSDKEKKK